MKTKTIDGFAMARLVLRAHREGVHVLAVERKVFEEALRAGRLPSDATFTCYDDGDENEAGWPAYCFGVLGDGEYQITHKTYDDLPSAQALGLVEGEREEP